MSVSNSFFGTVCCDTIYYVDVSEQDRASFLHSLSKIAIRPTFNFRLDVATWAGNDWSSERLKWDSVSLNPLVYKETLHIPSGSYGTFHVHNAPDVIDVTCKDHHLTLRKLTLELFNEKIRPFVAGREKLIFRSDQEVQEWYQTHNFER